MWLQQKNEHFTIINNNNNNKSCTNSVVVHRRWGRFLMFFSKYFFLYIFFVHRYRTVQQPFAECARVGRRCSGEVAATCLGRRAATAAATTTTTIDTTDPSAICTRVRPEYSVNVYKSSNHYIYKIEECKLMICKISIIYLHTRSGSIQFCIYGKKHVILCNTFVENIFLQF